MSVISAIRSGDVSQLPSRRDEDWRWTDLRGLIRQAPPPSPANTDAPPAGPFAAQHELAFVNGRAAQSGFAGAGVLALRFISASAGTSHVAEARIAVPAGQQLVVLESYEHAAGGYLAAAKVGFEVAEGASLERIVLADDAADAVSVSEAEVSLGPGARYAQTLVTSGARRQRLETRMRHPGGGATVRLDGIYLLADQRHADLTSGVEHVAVDGVTSQLTKGVARDQARAVFQGRIVVAEGADRTDARMGHHALILSDRAEVDAKPELEIYADDVSCAHGNTVGALDEEALFYARQRGIPEDAARALLMEAFVGEVVERIGHEPAREVVRGWVAGRLRA